MNTMVKELLNRQENERVEMATLLVSNTKEMLSNLGCDYMLSATAPGTDASKYETIINSLKEELKAAKKNVKTIEVVKEVKVPVETIKEVEVIKEVKVPVEVVKEVEIVKEVPVEVVKEVEVIKEVPVEIIKEVEVVKEIAKEISSDDKKIIEELQSRIRELEVKIEDKDKLITILTTYKSNTNKVDTTNKAIKSTNQITKEKAPAMPAVKTINEDMTILKNAKTWVFGTYKGVAFQSSKTIVGTVVFDTEKYSLKDEIEELLLKHKCISQYREVKDPVRIENELGVCHKIDTNTYTGFVTVGANQHCFTWRVSNENSPATIILKKRLENANYKFERCIDETVIKKIRTLVENHKIAEDKFTRELADANKNVTVDVKKQAEEQRARLAQLKMTGAPKVNKVTNVTDTPQVANTNTTNIADTNTTNVTVADTTQNAVTKTATAPTNNVSEVNKDINVSEDNEDIFAGLDFGFGDE